MNIKKKLKSVCLINFLIIFLLANCASMDLRVDTLRSDVGYGKLEPRIAFSEFKYYTGEPGRPYKELAQLIGQETPQVVLSRSAEQIIAYLCKKAWKNGADALIKVTISTTNVAGGYARTSPVVKGIAVRFTD